MKNENEDSLETKDNWDTHGHSNDPNNSNRANDRLVTPCGLILGIFDWMLYGMISEMKQESCMHFDVSFLQSNLQGRPLIFVNQLLVRLLFKGDFYSRAPYNR